ncbi:MAG: hypothetical protein GC168_15520 [Candidatus Hydrogenedens sp.]|nr:hypothetical protein [Candidatus Hydrogenedens sp.]
MNLVERHHFEGFTPRVHAVVLLTLLLGIAVLAVIFIQYKEVNVWANWTESSGLRKHTYTERIFVNSVFRTRANTWSNYAFVVVGAYTLALAWLDSRLARPATAGYLVRYPAFSALFGVSCVYLGIGSGLFHASLSRWGQQLDVASMYPAMVVLIAMNFARLFEKTTLHTAARWTAIAGAIGVSALLYIYKWEMSSSKVLGTLILSLVACSVIDVFRKSSFWRSWLLAAPVVFGLAVYIRELDVQKRFTSPDTWFQGHALWHVMCAAGLALAYLYARSERREA